MNAKISKANPIYAKKYSKDVLEYGHFVGIGRDVVYHFGKPFAFRKNVLFFEYHAVSVFYARWSFEQVEDIQNEKLIFQSGNIFFFGKIQNLTSHGTVVNFEIANIEIHKIIPDPNQD